MAKKDISVGEAVKDLISLLESDYGDLAVVEIKPQGDGGLIRLLGKDRSMRVRRYEVAG